MRKDRQKRDFSPTCRGVGMIKKGACLALAAALCIGSVFGLTGSEAKAASWPSGISVTSESAIVMEANTGTILYEKNIHTQHYPASITKILTTLLALENCELDETVTFSEDAVYKTEGSGIYRDVGEQMSLQDTLYAVMLESANECAYATAEHVTGGDYDAFVKMMNDRATELGCLNTNFTNPHGLPDEQHLTTAYDMALIAREAIQNDMFRTIISTKRYDLPATNKSEPLAMFNHHKMISANITTKYLYDGCIGGKTGYTQVARNTLVTYAERDGMMLICVLMKCEGTPYDDTAALFDYCFENFELWNIAESETRYSSDVSEDSTFMVDNEAFAQLDENAMIVLPKGADFAETEIEVSYDTAGDGAYGSLVYSYADRVVGQADVVKTGAQIEGFVFSQGNTSDVDTSELDVLQGTIEEDNNLATKVIIIIVIIALAIFLFFVIRAKMYSRHWRNAKHPSRQYVKIKNKKRRRRRRGRY